MSEMDPAERTQITRLLVRASIAAAILAVGLGLWDAIIHAPGNVGANLLVQWAAVAGVVYLAFLLVRRWERN